MLFLILLFILNFFFFICLGVEFLGFLLLIVYVGAISILFLFVVMLLDIRVLELHNTFLNYFSISFFLGLFFIIFIIFIFFYYFDFFIFSNFFYEFLYDFFIVSFKNNLQLFGEALYIIF